MRREERKKEKRFLKTTSVINNCHVSVSEEERHLLT